MRLTLVVLAIVAYSATATAPQIKQVEVVNQPDPQNVTGSVEVTNLPAVQDVNVTNAPAGPASRFQLVGFTAATFHGGSGLFGFMIACQAEFVPDSRICMSREVFDAVDVPTGSGDAWIQPTLVGSSGNNDPTDASGAAAKQGMLTCGFPDWSAGGLPTSSTGLTVDSNGGFRRLFCATGLSIACCAPVP